MCPERLTKSVLESGLLPRQEALCPSIRWVCNACSYRAPCPMYPGWLNDKSKTFSHHYKRVRLSVGRSVGQLVSPSHLSLKHAKPLLLPVQASTYPMPCIRPCFYLFQIRKFLRMQRKVLVTARPKRPSPHLHSRCVEMKIRHQD